MWHKSKKDFFSHYLKRRVNGDEKRRYVTKISDVRHNEHVSDQFTNLSDMHESLITLLGVRV